MNPEMLEKVMNCRDLPTLPAIAMRVIELTNSPSVSMRELAETIQTDQALSAKVLRTVNSSLFGLRTRCSSINQAIVMLGMSTVKTLALSFTLVGAINNCRINSFNLTDHWRRALFTAVAARSIGARAGLANPEEAFLGALLQDVGVIAMVQAIGPTYLAAVVGAMDDHRKVCKLELDAFEIQHPDVGALLARRWKLPDSLIMPIKFHERATAAPIEHGDICRCVGIGNIASDMLTTSGNTAPLLRKFYERCNAWFKLSTSQADDVLKAISQQTQDLASVLSIAAGHIPTSEQVLENAKQQLEAMPPTFAEVFGRGRLRGAGDQPGEGADELTGVADRFTFEKALISAFEQTRTGVGAMSLAIFELDGYDSVGGRYGPDAADSALIWLSGRLETAFSTVGGLVGRFSGSRFGVICSRVDRAQILRLCERVRVGIACDPLQLIAASGDAPSHISLTCSAGVAVVDASSIQRFENASQLAEVVEQALGAARRAGQNAVRVYAPSVAIAA